MRTLGLGLFFILSLVSHGVCMTDAARRDFIAACLTSGTFRFEDPDVRNSISGIVSEEGFRLVDIEPLLRMFSDSDKQKIIEQIHNCVTEIAKLATYDSRQARINTRDKVAVELFLTIKPEEYTSAILCKQPEILFNFRLAKMLMARGGNVEPTPKWLIDSVIAQSTASIGVNPLELDLDNLRCDQERLCELCGSIPIEVMSDKISIYQNQSRQIRVLAGNCEGKTGYGNERFIDF